MRISIVIPTSGRWALLERCLASARAQTRRPDEILVIDNSAGGLPAGLALDGARLAREPRRGVVFARNRGLEESRGDVAAFLDDDCAAPSGWLAAVERAFDDPAVAAVGGPARLVWAGRPPLIARSRAVSYLGGIDLGPRRRTLDASRDYLMGGNLAIRLSALGGKRFVGVFPFPGCGQCAEDTEMTRHLAARHSVVYEPQAWVEHFVCPEKVRWDRLAVRVFCMEAAAARLSRHAAREMTLLEKALGLGLKATQLSGRVWGALSPSSR